MGLSRGKSICVPFKSEDHYATYIVDPDRFRLLHFSQKGTEACLLKMFVSGKGLTYPTLLHDDERHTIGQAPLFVGAFAVHL